MKDNPIRLFLLTLSVAVLSIFSLNAQQVFHVSPAGANNGNGTIESPFNSIQLAQKAVAKINAGMFEDITVYLHGGTYYLSSPLIFKEKDSGTNGHNVIYKAYNNEKPLVSGGGQITGWERVKGDIYKAHLDRDSKLRTLFVNGTRMRMAGTEDAVQGMGPWGQYPVIGNEPWALGAGTSIDGIKFKTGDVGLYENAEDIELVQFNVWTEKILCARGAEQVGDTTVLKLQQPYGAIATNLAWAGRMNYYGGFIIPALPDIPRAGGRLVQICNLHLLTQDL